MSLMKYFKSKGDSLNQPTQIDPEEDLSDQDSLNSCDDDIWDNIIDEEIERQRKLMKSIDINSFNISKPQKKSSNPEKKQPKRKRTAYLFYTSVCLNC